MTPFTAAHKHTNTKKKLNEYIISATHLTAQLTAQFVLIYAKRQLQ